MKKLIVLLFISVLVFSCEKDEGVLVPNDKQNIEIRAQQEKVQICHKLGNGQFNLIEVNGNAAQAHISHGDGYPGECYDPEQNLFLTEVCEIVEDGCTNPLSCPEGLDWYGCDMLEKLDFNESDRYCNYYWEADRCEDKAYGISLNFEKLSDPNIIGDVVLQAYKYCYPTFQLYVVYRNRSTGESFEDYIDFNGYENENIGLSYYDYLVEYANSNRVPQECN